MAAAFKELTDRVNYPKLEEEVLSSWKAKNVFRRSIEERAGHPGFTFFEGPPTANGRPGIHHVMSRALKDLVCRYKTMRGYQVHRKAGWDTHGLPVEIEVEKMLGFRHKDDIVRYGVAKFNDECRKSVWRYKSDWERLTERMGYWVDMDHPYITFENSYIESIWWALKRFYDRDMIYKGYKIQPYCPRCETPLSSHEVSLGYEDVKDPSIYVKMKVKGEENTWFLVWTTTPWTLISNVALAVHPEVEYVRVEQNGEHLILAEARTAVLDGEYTVHDRFRGKALAGKEYERLFSYHPVSEKAFYVVTAEFVTTEDGSGIVHMAPAYGEDDYQTSKRYGLPTIHPVNKSGEFGPEVTDFAGLFVKEADAQIIQNLKGRRLLYKKEMITHSYPHCWRCKTPLLYYARESWYIATTKYARRMVELNRTINWVPPEVGEGRFGNWLEENKDWSLSRDRFWGTPLPIWICDNCDRRECVGSVKELEAASGQTFRRPETDGPAESGHVPGDAKLLDLHKPFVDGIRWTCVCGGTMSRVPELIDVWFDSGAMSFAQWHYPFENKEIIDSGEQYPADYICEGIDQTRGWFYSLHAIGTFLFDKPAYKNILVNELILDKEGQKMSKSRGNTVDPFRVLEKYGADATRWYLVTTSPPWRPTLFDEEGLVEVQRKFFGTLVNTYAFFSLYANIDGFTFAEPPVENARRPEIDRWILSVLNSLVKSYESAMDGYDVTRAARAVEEFTIDQLSNWYVRRNRRRFWKSEMGPDKLSAYQTLYQCLVTVARLMAPFAPFLADELFCNLNSVARRDASDSVHLARIPAPEGAAIDASLESKMEKAQRVVAIVRSIRNQKNLKVRQPLKKILIPVRNPSEAEELKAVGHIILEETNVKELDPRVDESLIRYSIKPNYRNLGQKHGKLTSKIAEAIKIFTGDQIGALDAAGMLRLSVDGQTVEIGRDDAEIIAESIEGWAVGRDKYLTVALDTNLTEDLIDEGIAREFVNRVQNMRKDAGLNVTDRIRIVYRGTDRLRKALHPMSAYVRTETLAVDLVPSESIPSAGAAGTGEIEINGEQCSVAIFLSPLNGTGA